MARVRSLLSLLVLVALCVPVEAQQTVTLAVRRPQRDTLSSNGDSITVQNILGMASMRIQTLDSYSGTWEVQCSVDGVTFDADDEVNLVLDGQTSTVQSVTDTVGIWTANIAGCSAVKVIATAGFAASDTTVVIGMVETGGGSGGGGGAGGGDFDQATFNAAFGTAGTADSQVLSVQGIASGTPLAIDDADIIAAINGTPTVHIDETQLSEAAVVGNVVASAPDGTPTMCEAKSIDGSALPNVVTEGQFNRFACGPSGNLLVTSVTADGLASPFGREDDASANQMGGSVVFAIRDDTLDVRSGTEGDLEPFHTNANGALWTIDVNSAAKLTSLQLIDDVVFTDDAAFTPATSKGIVIGGQADDTSTDSVDEGDFGALRISLDRLLYTRMADPCSGGATKLYLPFDITTATTTEITPSLAGSSTHYYICALNIVSQGANSVNLVDDNTDNCASVTASLISSGLAATDGWYFAANGGLTMGNGIGSIMRTQTSNSVLCLVTSAATELHGQFVVVAAP